MKLGNFPTGLQAVLNIALAARAPLAEAKNMREIEPSPVAGGVNVARWIGLSAAAQSGKYAGYFLSTPRCVLQRVAGRIAFSPLGLFRLPSAVSCRREATARNWGRAVAFSQRSILEFHKMAALFLVSWAVLAVVTIVAYPLQSFLIIGVSLLFRLIRDSAETRRFHPW